MQNGENGKTGLFCAQKSSLPHRMIQPFFSTVSLGHRLTFFCVESIRPFFCQIFGQNCIFYLFAEELARKMGTTSQLGHILHE